MTCSLRGTPSVASAARRTPRWEPAARYRSARRRGRNRATGIVPTAETCNLRGTCSASGAGRRTRSRSPLFQATSPRNLAIGTARPAMTSSLRRIWHAGAAGLQTQILLVLAGRSLDRQEACPSLGCPKSLAIGTAPAAMTWFSPGTRSAEGVARRTRIRRPRCKRWQTGCPPRGQTRASETEIGRAQVAATSLLHRG